MPYRRRYNRRRPRQRPRYGYFGRFGNDATKAMRMAGKALSLLNVETHRYDNNTAIASQNTTGTVHNLFGIPQGDDTGNRQGNSIKLTRIDGRIAVFLNGVTAQTVCRIIIGIDHQANGANPAVTDVLASDDVYALRNMDKAKRFTILMDEVALLSDSSDQIKWFEIHKPLDIHVEFTGPTASLADVSTNNIFLIAVSTNAVSGPTVNRFVRIKYLDN